MPPQVATLVFIVGIAGLFWLDRDPETQTSKALWIPAVWLFLISSRPLSLWLGIAPYSSADATEAYVEGSPIDRAVFLALVIAALAVAVRRRDRVGPLLRNNGAILLFFLFCAISILWSDFPFVAFKRWSKAIGDLAMVLIIVTESDPLGALKRLITRLSFLLFPLSVLFIKYYPHLGRLLTQSWTMEATGVTTQKNGLGAICMIYGLGLVWIFRNVYRDRADPARKGRLLAYGANLLMAAWLLQQSNSMTSITGLAMAGGVMLLAGRPALVPKRAFVHLLVLAVLGLSLFALFFDSGGGLLQELGRNPTLTGRTDIWRLVLGVHINRWVGTGFESFWLGDRLEALRHANFNFPINEAHNGYIEVYLNLGWAGVSLLALLLMTGYRRVIAMFRHAPEIGSLYLGIFLITIFESFTEAAFRMMSTPWIFLLLVTFAGSQFPSRRDLTPVEADLSVEPAEGREEVLWLT